MTEDEIKEIRRKLDAGKARRREWVKGLDTAEAKLPPGTPIAFGPTNQQELEKIKKDIKDSIDEESSESHE